MGDRPYTVLSCGMSLDGYLDDASDERLVLSDAADLDRVDGLRASCDAILVGAGTVRADNPRLRVRDPDRVAARVEAGGRPSPLRVTVTGRGDLSPQAHLFAADRPDETLVYCDTACLDRLSDSLAGRATVCDGGHPLSLDQVVIDLRARGVDRLMVEGGGRVHTQFLAEGLADELQVVVAPFFVGDSRARRFVDDADFPWTSRRPARLVGVRPIGDLVLLRYALSDRFDEENR